MTRVLALHGFTGAGADFDPLRSRLPSAWQWHTPDLPGHGANRLEPGSGVFSLDQHLAFFEEHFQNSPPSLLIGYSMGGRLALHLALRHPAAFSRLVLIGASPGLADANAREQRRLTDEALARQIETEADLPAFFTRWWANPLFTGLLAPQHAPLRARRLRENTAAGLATSLRGVGTGALPPLHEALPLLRLPVLCIAGAEDPKFSDIAREMAALLPDARVALIPSAYHLPHIEVPDAVATRIADFAAERHALIALGSNLGDRAAHIAAAVDALRALPGTRLLAVSRLRETKPVGYAAQPDFLNAVTAVATTRTPEELLDACLRIEAQRGRVRTIINGPRTLDMDLLFYEGETRATPQLTLPHPRWAQRAFVCEPLAEILRTAPLAKLPVWDTLRAELGNLGW